MVDVDDGIVDEIKAKLGRFDEELSSFELRRCGWGWQEIQEKSLGHWQCPNSWPD
jgi:hypothetical protein